MTIDPPPVGITTDRLAAAIGVQPVSIRIRLCRTGSYYGVRPIRMPNRRLLWPSDAAERLAAQRQQAGGGA